jgi:hypothetical protein
MAILVGFHVEGWDHLICHVFLAKLLGIPETDLCPDWIDVPGRGWAFVMESLPKALKRFYHQCAQAVVVGIDNDGNRDLGKTGLTEDPARPRHWNHAPDKNTSCRWCILDAIIAQTRPELNWLPQKVGAIWPILLAVPVEMIESWLLICQAIVTSGSGQLNAESTSRASQKHLFYRKPSPSREDVETVALPLIRQMTPAQVRTLEAHSRSFAQFAQSVASQQALILGPRDCWQEGDGVSNRPT